MPDHCEIWDLRLTWHGKSRAEVIPKSDAELCASLIEAEKGIAAVATHIASGAAAHLSLGDLTADIVLDPFVCNGFLGRSSTMSNSLVPGTNLNQVIAKRFVVIDVGVLGGENPRWHLLGECLVQLSEMRDKSFPNR